MNAKRRFWGCAGSCDERSHTREGRGLLLRPFACMCCGRRPSRGGGGLSTADEQRPPRWRACRFSAALAGCRRRFPDSGGSNASSGRMLSSLKCQPSSVGVFVAIATSVKLNKNGKIPLGKKWRSYRAAICKING